MGVGASGKTHRVAPVVRGERGVGEDWGRPRFERRLNFDLRLSGSRDAADALNAPRLKRDRQLRIVVHDRGHRQQRCPSAVCHRRAVDIQAANGIRHECVTNRLNRIVRCHGRITRQHDRVAVGNQPDRRPRHVVRGKWIRGAGRGRHCIRVQQIVRRRVDSRFSTVADLRHRGIARARQRLASGHHDQGAGDD